mmetsp:Transcript_42042/g.164678  ORF Transcript_42042/g.164678 Transcript_42042/m.164678 type:complete len:195 (+) Transcript_42042:154-738(+)
MTSLGYWALRIMASARSVAYQKPNPENFWALVKTIEEDMERPLTFLSVMKGNSMSPTLNPRIKDGESGDKLIIRRMKMPNTRVFKGDVVVVRDPTKEERKYVRRVAAVHGDEMVSDDPNMESYTLNNEYWVLRDNQLSKEPDSRQFGPVHEDNIIGRVLYRVRGAKDHDRVQNSSNAWLSDSIILSNEEKLYGT